MKEIWGKFQRNLWQISAMCKRYFEANMSKINGKFKKFEFSFEGNMERIEGKTETNFKKIWVKLKEIRE